jgi:hypothetical protein
VRSPTIVSVCNCRYQKSREEHTPNMTSTSTPTHSFSSTTLHHLQPLLTHTSGNFSSTYITLHETERQPAVRHDTIFGKSVSTWPTFTRTQIKRNTRTSRTTTSPCLTFHTHTLQRPRNNSTHVPEEVNKREGFTCAQRRWPLLFKHPQKKTTNNTSIAQSILLANHSLSHIRRRLSSRYRSAC